MLPPLMMDQMGQMAGEMAVGAEMVGEAKSAAAISTDRTSLNMRFMLFANPKNKKGTRAALSWTALLC